MSLNKNTIYFDMPRFTRCLDTYKCQCTRFFRKVFEAVQKLAARVLSGLKPLGCARSFKPDKARFKRRTLHVPNLMQMRKIYCFRSFALDSGHVMFDVWNGPKALPLVF